MLAPEFGSLVEAVKDALFDSLALILGLEGDDAEAGIRFSWPVESGSEKFAATPTTDICYIRVTSSNRPGTGFINTSYEGIDAQSLYATKDMHVSIHVDYIFYGPHSAEHANRLYMMIHSDDARYILHNAHMAPIPHTETPTATHELIDGNWYERHDVGIDFYMVVKYSGTVDAMQSAPAIVTAINE